MNHKLNLNSVSKDQKLQLLKALAKGLLIKKDLQEDNLEKTLKKLEVRFFLEVRSQEGNSYSINQDNINEASFYDQLELSRTLLGTTINHHVINVVYSGVPIASCESDVDIKRLRSSQ